MMDGIEKIYHGRELLSIIIRAEYHSDGIVFITPDDFPHQIGYMNRPEGYVIEPHVHNKVPRNVEYTQETLVVRSGKVRVDFYSASKDYLESRVIGKGDIILLAAGGHGFTMMEPSEIVEIKQGPYAGALDKVRFVPVNDERLIIK